MIQLRTVKRGDRVAVWKPDGDVRFVDGPRRMIIFRERVEPLRRYSAESHEYLAVRMRNGRTENRRGPTDLWFNPVEHESITVEPALPIDAHEALVVYQRQEDDRVTRRVLTGPAQYVPQENEWLHEFCWHGGEVHRKEADHKQQIAHRRELQLLDAEHLHTENEERLQFLREIQSLQVDVTQYLVAQYQHPDRLIQIDGTGRSQLHLHEKLGV